MKLLNEVLPNLFKIEIPLPRNPLKALNSYVIKSNDKNLIVDTGMKREECEKVMFSALEKLKIDLDKTDFFITHMHADHSGLITTLATNSSTVYGNQPDANLIIGNERWDERKTFLVLNGFPEDEVQKAIDKHPGRIYCSQGYVEFKILNEGDTITVGNYQFKTIKTPGHTEGHICLYEEEKKILLSGDHILDDITPNIGLFLPGRDPLGEYLVSLDKIYGLDVKLVLPGHRSLIKDCKERIRQLKHHHELRANEVLSILENGSENAYTMASKMTWEMTYESWDLFPVQQKWFATGEALAHLKYLEELGKVKSKMNMGINTFSLK